MRTAILRAVLILAACVPWPARASPPKNEFRFRGAPLGQPIIRVEQAPAGRVPANPEADRRLQVALDLQADPTASADRQHSSWCAFAAMGQANPYLEDARTACRRWTRFMQQRQQLRLAFTKDFRDVQRKYARADLPQAKKGRMVEAFLAAYVTIDDDAAYVLARQWLQPTVPVTAKKETAVEVFHDDDEPASARDVGDGNPEVARVIARKNAAVQQCFEHAVQDNPNESEHIKVRVVVGTDARVTNVIVLGASAPLAGCIRAKLLGINGLPLLTRPEAHDQSFVFGRQADPHDH